MLQFESHVIPGTLDSLFSLLLFGGIMDIHAKTTCVYGESSFILPIIWFGC